MLVEVAPIAGYTDYTFRNLLIKCGAKVVWTEMVSAAAIYYNARAKNRALDKTLVLLKHDKREDVKTVVQLFGKDPKHFVFAINYLKENNYFDRGGFSEVNINMGCPANRIIKNGEGASLSKTPDLAAEIVRACVAVSPVSVSVKMRLDNAAVLSKACENAGASRVIIHGRYAKQGYGGAADWNAIAEIVKNVKIPVIANGDVRDRKSAEECLRITGAAGVMIGRAVMKFKYFDVNCKQYICDEEGLRNFWSNNFS